MTRRDPELRLRTSPHLSPQLTTPRLMADVNLALLPIVGAAIWFFGISAVLVLAASVAGAVGAEFVMGRPRGASLKDNSALLTGVLLGLTLPPGLPLWMAFVGGAVAIGLGKSVWGGLGHNLFNPALVGRAFLQAAFPVPLTTWVAHGSDFWHIHSTTFAMPLMHAEVDAWSGATPLASMKFEHVETAMAPLLEGNIAGSLGETSGILLIICGLWLASRRAFDWRIPVAILLSVAVLSSVFFAIDPEAYPSPQFMLLSGGLLLGTVFMATDPVTSPLAPKGAWLFGIGVGLLVVLIRLWGGLPEGVMYSILLMNAATPLIERAIQPKTFGARKQA